MIKVLNIKTRKEYNKLLKNYLLLSVASLKYISKKDNFKEIVVQAKEVEQTSFSGKYYISTIVDGLGYIYTPYSKGEVV